MLGVVAEAFLGGLVMQKAGNDMGWIGVPHKTHVSHL